MSGRHLQRWRSRILSAPTVCVAVVAVVGVVYRIGLLVGDVPPANSDEGTAGLAALHIAQGREWPIFFYGQQYMGTLHSYLAAPFVHFFGTAWWVLRIPSVLMYLLFLVVVYRLVRSLYGPWFGVCVVGILAFGSDRIVKNQVIGAGGYSDVAVATAAVMLVAVGIALNPPSKKPVAYFVWGLLAGYVAWTHWLGLPYVAVSAALLVLVGGARLRRMDLGAVVVGLVLGSAPLIWYNLFSGQGNSLSVLFSLSGAGGAAPWIDRIHGAVVVGLPLSSGICAPSDCRPWQLWWGPVYLVLLLISVVVSARSVRRDIGAERVRSAGRLALAVGGAATLLAYVVSASSATSPIESARYLHYGLVSLPAVLWPAWKAASDARRRILPGVAGALVLVAFTMSTVVATGQLIGHRQQYASRAVAERTLLDYLDRRDLRYVYSEYWTCNRITFLTAEKVRCAVLDDNLKPGLDRYAPYRDEVGRAARVSYLMPTGSAADQRLSLFARSSGERAEIDHVAGYAVYLFDRRVQLG